MAFTFGATKNAKDTDMDFEPLQPGTYEFQIENVTLVPFSGSDKVKPCNKLHIQLRTDLDGAHSRKVWDDIFLDATHNYSMNRLAKIVQSCGISLSDSAGEKEIADSLIGELCNAEVIIHEYNGKKSNRISKYIVPKTEEQPKAPATSGIDISSDDLPF